MNSLKRAVFEAALATGQEVSVLVDRGAPGLELPDVPEVKEVHEALVLVYGTSMPVPIPDLDSGPDGIRATLSFSRTPRATFLPWAAVAGLMVPGLMFCQWEPADVVAREPEPEPRLRSVP